jgi:4-alpha-glucanotransferase
MRKRGSGVLLHITSLPSPFGVGDLGPSAYQFADFLADARQSYWQVLPLNPTSPAYGNSPYSSVSTFAGNTLLVSPEMLVAEGFLSGAEIESAPPFPEGRCDYEGAAAYKERLLRLAYEGFVKSGRDREGFAFFCEEQALWLDTYALFVSIKRRMEGRSFGDWPPELRDRAMDSIEAHRAESAAEIEQEKFGQYLFFRQWAALKKHCNERGVQLIGDVPIYVSYDSADVWANAAIFELDREKRLLSVGGVPPDYFSATGQLWGNPVYNWDALRQTGYAWWIERLRHTFALLDAIRIDHFRGLVRFWGVPASEKNAVNGRWVDVPVRDFLARLSQRFFSLPIIVEDLGIITPDVREVVEEWGFPGMKVLLFAFGEDDPMHIYLPHTYGRNCVVYTGTHDNNTARGWFEHEARPDEKERLARYLGREVRTEDVHWDLVRLAMASVALMAVFPLQDILGLGAEAQMNRPSVAFGNWGWRLAPGELTAGVAERLRALTVIYGRA